MAYSGTSRVCRDDLLLVDRREMGGAVRLEERKTEKGKKMGRFK